MTMKKFSMTKREIALSISAAVVGLTFTALINKCAHADSLPLESRVSALESRLESAESREVMIGMGLLEVRAVILGMLQVAPKDMQAAAAQAIDEFESTVEKRTHQKGYTIMQQ